MKEVMLSSDKDSVVNLVPDVVADKLEESGKDRYPYAGDAEQIQE